MKGSRRWFLGGPDGPLFNQSPYFYRLALLNKRSGAFSP